MRRSAQTGTRKTATPKHDISFDTWPSLRGWAFFLSENPSCSLVVEPRPVGSILMHITALEGSSYAFHVAVVYRRPDPDHFASGAMHAPLLSRVLATLGLRGVTQ